MHVLTSFLVTSSRSSPFLLLPVKKKRRSDWRRSISAYSSSLIGGGTGTWPSPKMADIPPCNLSFLLAILNNI
jgi:hypothetical protein